MTNSNCNLYNMYKNYRDNVTLYGQWYINVCGEL